MTGTEEKSIVFFEEKPISFTGESLPAILSGEKKQTWRAIRPQPPKGTDFIDTEHGKPDLFWWAWDSETEQLSWVHRCPYGQVGDRLWVKEKWGVSYCDDDIDSPYLIWYSDGKTEFKIPRLPMQNRMFWSQRLNAERLCENDDGEPRWRSPRFMPRWASRINLAITKIRALPLWHMTIGDYFLDGNKVPKGADKKVSSFGELIMHHEKYRDYYKARWNKLNAKRGFPYENDPWSWVIDFEIVKK